MCATWKLELKLFNESWQYHWLFALCKHTRSFDAWWHFPSTYTHAAGKEATLVAYFTALRPKRERSKEHRLPKREALGKRDRCAHYWPTLSKNLFMPAAKLVPQSIGRPRCPLVPGFMTMTDMIVGRSFPFPSSYLPTITAFVVVGLNNNGL